MKRINKFENIKELDDSIYAAKLAMMSYVVFGELNKNYDTLLGRLNYS